MEQIRNYYQLSKTLRFSLTLKKKKHPAGKDIFVSHQALDELVRLSIDRIKKVLPKNCEKMKLSKRIDSTFSLLKSFLDNWEWILVQNRMLVIDKDYYRVLCKNIGIDGFWWEGKIKKPQTRNISLQELDSRQTNDRTKRLAKSRKESILEFWQKGLEAAREKFDLATEKLNEFKRAEEIKRTDFKPNEVELRKAVLSLLKIVLEILEPLYNRQISFPKVGKLDLEKEENRKWKNIVYGEDFEKLYKNIGDIKFYFEKNGGSVPYCRATLNQKTRIKSAQSTDRDVSVEIGKLSLDKLLKEHRNAVNFNSYIEHLTVSEKLKKFFDTKVGLFERSQLFKYTPIRASVILECAQKLASMSPEISKESEVFLRNIGVVRRTPAKDFHDDKLKFNIDNYPLKESFDFAWEGLAKKEYHREMEFPEEICKKFLREFGISSNSKDFKLFKLYANLLELDAVLTELDRGVVEQRKLFLDRGKSIVEEIDWKYFLPKHGEKNKEHILNRLKSDQRNNVYDKAKRDLSVGRGRLKNKVKKYKELTETYKNISMEVGRLFASMRDKISDKMDLNRVSHYAMIIEDANVDRYVLLQKADSNIQDLIYSKCKCEKGDFKTYSVNSITSRAIAKMLRKRRIENLRNRKNIFSNSSIAGQKSTEDMERKRLEELKNFIRENKWDRDFKLELNCQDKETLEKEIDSKGYEFREGFISKDVLYELVKEKDCLLLPIVNQDLAKKKKGNGNQFTKDWNAVFSKGNPWRLTPEFRVSYRQPTPEYPISEIGDKRYSRFSMTVHFLCDYIPKENFVSLREQIENFRNGEKQKEEVLTFNDKVNGKTESEKMQAGISALSAKWGTAKKKERVDDKKENKKEKFYVFGIDRGQKELATLCVIDQDKKIQGPFKIYTRTFNTETKEWNHKFLEDRYILDLSNLRVESTLVIDGVPKKEKVLVDLSEVLVKDKDGNYIKPKKLQIRLHQVAYIRKLQFKMQNEPEKVRKWYKENPTDELIARNFVDKENGELGLVSFLGVAVEELKDTLPIERIRNLLDSFEKLSTRKDNGENVDVALKRLVELEPVDGIKVGVVANMVGVIAFLLSKYDYNAYISLEDLSKPFEKSFSGLSGMWLSGASGKASDVEKYAGIGLYNFFEMQLLKKLFRIQQSSDRILHLVPSFRAVRNYELNVAGKDKVKNQFGIVFFVDANETSKRCPKCEVSNKIDEKDKFFKKYPEAKKGPDPEGKKDCWVYRDKKNGNDIIHCYVCGFDTTEEHMENPFKFIKSGDDNAAYIISTEAIKAYELAKTVVENKNGEEK